MGFQGNLDLNFWLVRGMARKAGVNLSAAMADGRLERADVAKMIMACRDCGGADGCMAYLAETEGPQATAPDWCGNAALFAAVKALD